MDDLQVFDFGIRIKELRQSQQLTQAQVAAKIGTTKNTIYRYEANLQEPPLSVLRKMALIYGTSLDYIAGLNNNISIELRNMSQEKEEILRAFIKHFINHED